MVIWEKIPGYEDYMVSDNGEIKSLKNNKQRILKQYADGSGRYLFVHLMKEGKYKMNLVHRIVANAFIENKENKPQINHKNCNTQDNRVKNLEWVTAKENMLHAKKMGHAVPPPTYKGNFGKNHNKSIGYLISCPDGVIRKFYSGLEFRRKTGLDNTNLSYAAIKKGFPYNFKRGKMKGYTILGTFKSYVGKLNKGDSKYGTHY